MTPEEEFHFNRRLADERNREQVERRLQALEQSIQAHGRQLTTIQEDVEGMAPILGHIQSELEQLRLGDMSREERAAIRLMAQKFVLQGETDAEAQRRWTRVFALVAAGSPLITLTLQHFLH